MRAEMPPEFEELLGALRNEGEFADAIAAAANAVRRWSWRRAPSAVEFEEPFWAERNGAPVVGKEADGDPPDGVAADVIGRDEAGELIFATLRDRRGDDAGELGRVAEAAGSTTRLLGPGRAEIARAWRQDGALTRLARASRRHDDEFDLALEHYIWRSGRLIEIERMQGELTPEGWRGLSSRSFVLDYDPDGRLLSIAEPGEDVLYRRATLTPKELKTRLDAFTTRLAERVFEVVTTEAPPSARLYAVMLAYEDEDDPETALLPELLWGRVEDRSALADDPERDHTVWDPAGFHNLSADPEWEPLQGLAGEAAALGLELDARRQHAKRREILVQASALLNRRDWSALPIAREFVVLAAEHELVDAHANLRRAATAEQLASLEAGGWI